MSVFINRVTLTGNLARDPEHRVLSNRSQLCTLRVATSTRRKNGAGAWSDFRHFFDVVVFGPDAENAARYLAKGRGVAIDGRLEMREWTGPDNTKRSGVQIIAETVQFLGAPVDNAPVGWSRDDANV